jgi:hypothetical protein
MTPKEFQKSNLAVELKTGRKHLEDVLISRGLSDEQCERAGATRTGSVVDLLSEIVVKEFLVLMEVSDRLPSSPMNLLANADGQTSTASGAAKGAANALPLSYRRSFPFCASYGTFSSRGWGTWGT